MGMMKSFLGKGGPPLYKQFVEKDITDFNDFHISVLDILKLLVQIEDCFFAVRQWTIYSFSARFRGSLAGHTFRSFKRFGRLLGAIMYYIGIERNKKKGCYGQWKEAKGANKKTVFVKFVSEKVNLSKLDDYTVITGIVTPPAAMAVKRAGENLLQLKAMKAIPDVVFVPSATVLALISAKLSRRIFLRSLTPSSS